MAGPALRVALSSEPRLGRSAFPIVSYLRDEDETEVTGSPLARPGSTVEQDRAALTRLFDYNADPFEVKLYELAAGRARCSAPSDTAQGSTSARRLNSRGQCAHE